MLYICGHPGQGKSAVVDQVLSDHIEKLPKVVIFRYNAMNFESLKKFIIKIMDDVPLKAVSEQIASKRVKPDDTVTEDFEDATIEEMTAKLIRHIKMSFSLNKNRKKEQEANMKFILVIDEIDNFSKSTQAKNSFLNFLNLLMDKEHSTFRPHIVGIANSVELFQNSNKI